MARIVIHMRMGAAGHWFPTFRLASQLAARGHQVTYVGIPDDHDLVGNRFAFQPVFEDVAPRGLTAKLNEAATRTPLRVHLAYHRILRRAVAAYLDGRMERVLAELGADMLIADMGMQLTLLAAHRLGLPYLGLSTDFTAPFRPGVPPVTSALRPDGRLATQARIAAAWAPLLLRARLLSWVGYYGWPRAAVRAMARRCHFPLSRIDRASVHATLQIPHAVLCPASLDFPDAAPAGRRYGDPLVDLDRVEPARGGEPWLASGRPVVYCSLGSHAHLFAGRGGVLRAVSEACARLPAFEHVLQVGKGFDVARLGPLPPNVHVLAWAPQMRILASARVAVTHGGLGSVKECIASGVPMLVVPHVNDQPGNAARVAFHGLGRALSARELEAGAVAAAITDLAENPRYRQAMARVRRDFADADAAQTIAGLVEGHLRDRTAHAPSPALARG